MKVKAAKFMRSAPTIADCPRDRRPECAFVGRSNVGKSTLLNTLLNKKGLAKTSATPGKTQTMNYFLVNGKIYFVDLPGYGYAKVPLSLKEAWNQSMFAYLRERDTLKLVVSLVDARHKPTTNDIDMMTLLDQAELPTVVVATKIDKLKKSERRDSIRRIHHVLDLPPEALIVPYSSVTGEGTRELWNVIDELMKEVS